MGLLVQYKQEICISLRTAAMKISLLLLSVLIGLSFAKLSKEELKAMLEKYRDSDENPCGKSVKAKECVCKDGAKYVPSIDTVGKCGKEGPDFCLCPDGKKFNPPAKLIQATAEFLGCE